MCLQKDQNLFKQQCLFFKNKNIQKPSFLEILCFWIREKKTFNWHASFRLYQEV